MSSNGAKPDSVKILVFMLYYLPHRTGVPLYVQRVSEELVRRGHQVTILTARYKPELPEEEIIGGVRVVRLWTPPIAISRGMVMPSFPWKAYQLIREHDVISINTPLLETALISVLAGLTGRKMVVTHHGDLILPKSLSNLFIKTVMFALYRFMANQAARLIAYSQDYADHSYYLLPYRDKVSVIYPPIHMPPPDPHRAEELRQQWANDDGPVIGFAGRFVEEKRPDLLIKALDIINQRYPKARVVFAGEYDIKYENTWEHYQPLVERYKDQLIFLGLLQNMQDMADFFAACDVIALTSDTECFALVQVEAMLCGTPVVMTNIPGGRVPVQVTGMGKLAHAGDAESIGRAIVDVLDNPDHYRKSRETIEETFSFKETVDRYEQYYRENAIHR